MFVPMNSQRLLLLSPCAVRSGCGGGNNCYSSTTGGTAASNVERVPVNVPEPMLSSKNTAQFRKGAGGRASFSGNVVTVFGNTGFTGLSLVNRLAKHGNQLILPYRCDSTFLKEHKVACELGQVLFFPYQPRDEESIRKAVKYSNVVINLIGANLNTPNFNMHQSNVEVAARIARISREMGVERLVHISAMGADPDHISRYKKNGSFLKTKGLGEQAVRSEFPNATIIRPAVMFGEYDNFIFPMLTRFRKNPMNVVHIYNAGKGIYKMPLFYNDFCYGVTKAAMDPTALGKTYEFVGPYCYEMCELADFIYVKGGLTETLGYYYRRTALRDPWFLGMSFISLLLRKAFRGNRTWVSNGINWEWLDFVEATSDVLTGDEVLTLKDLGITTLHEFENMGGWYCITQSFIGPFGFGLKDYPHPPLPLRSPPLYKHKPPRFPAADVHTEQRPFSLHRKVMVDRAASA